MTKFENTKGPHLNPLSSNKAMLKDNTMLKNFLGFYFSALFYVCLSVLGPLAWAKVTPSDPEKCSGIIEELKARRQTLEKMSTSLDSLLGSSQNYEMPIQVIFQVDFKNPEMVEKRIKELSQKLEPTSVFSTFTSIHSSSCTFSEIKEVLLEFIQEQSKINEKKVEFLKIEAEKRNALLSTYESNRKKATDQYGIENQLSASKAALNYRLSLFRQSPEVRAVPPTYFSVCRSQRSKLL